MAYSTALKVAHSNVVIYKERTYYSDSLDEFKQRFKEFQDKGVILPDCNFEDDHWFVNNGVRRMVVKFRINEITCRESSKSRALGFKLDALLNAMRCFALLKLDNTTTIGVRNIVYSIIYLLEQTHFFADNAIILKEFRQKCKAKSGIGCIVHCDHLLEFLDYFELLPMDYRYYNVMQAADQEYSVAYRRALPTYESMFKFDRLLSRFLEDSKTNEVIAELKVKFYVIILWWLITTQIPLRTTEFCLIPYDCTKVVDGKYKLIIRRCELKGNKRSNQVANTIEDDYKIEKVEINKKLYDAIIEYKSVVDKYDLPEGFDNDEEAENKQREFLLSYSAYGHYVQQARRRNLKYINKYSNMFLASILRNFYNEILVGQYNLDVVDKIHSHTLYHIYENKLQKSHRTVKVGNKKPTPKNPAKKDLKSNEIEKIQPMDTRHFAIMNMILQDVPMAAVMNLAGHREIKSTFHYYNHMDNFMFNYTYHLAKKFNKKDTAQKDNSIVPFKDSGSGVASIEKNYYFLTKIQAGEIKAKEVDNGWCLYQKDDFKPCRLVGFDCERSCDYLVRNEEGTQKTKETIVDNERQIDISMKIIREIIKDRKKIKDYETHIRSEILKIRSYVNEDSRMLVSTGQIK